MSRWSLFCFKTIPSQLNLLTKTSNRGVIADGKSLKSSWCYQGQRNFQISRPKPAIHPIIMIVLRPVLKGSAMLFGRTIRKRWQRLSADERVQLAAKLRNKKSHIAAGCTILAGLGISYYIDHVEEDPLTGRKRFIMYNQEQMNEIADMEFQRQIDEFQHEVIPSNCIIYKRVVRVANRILKANKDEPQVFGREWTVTVIDRPDITNAYVLPNGKIVIFSGILNVASNDDQLAIVLSHEIAHVLLQHVTENLSKAFFVEMVLLIPLVLFWALLPDAAALFSQWLSSALANVMIHLPHSRAVEKEADEVGLVLAARACYDIRDAPVFWGKMAKVNAEEPLEWLSTHPNNETRQVDLSKLLPDALNVRAGCSCPRLPPMTRAQELFIPKS